LNRSLALRRLPSEPIQYIPPVPQHHFSTVLFDLDGTLIDSTELILSSYRHTLETHRGAAPPDDVWIAGLGTPLWVQFRKFTDDPGEIDAMVATYRDHNLAHHDAMVREFPGVLDAVRHLHERGTRLGIVTSKKRQGAGRGLTLCGFDGLFDVVVTADDVQRHKPDPEPVVRALERLDSVAADTVFVGDSPHDIDAGRSAGVATGAVLWSPFPRRTLEEHQPDYWIAEPTDLSKLC
jgi:pyrophosphatase PpaX